MLREFTFGDTPCAVAVRTRGAGAVAEVFLIDPDGTRCPLPTIEGDGPDESLALAAVEPERLRAAYEGAGAGLTAREARRYAAAKDFE